MDVSEMVAPPTSLPGPRSVKVPLHGLWSPGLALEEIAGYLGVVFLKTNTQYYYYCYYYNIYILNNNNNNNNNNK